MKKFFKSAVFVFLTFVGPILAAEEQVSEENAVKSTADWNLALDPFGFILGGVGLGLEYRLSDQVLLGPFFMSVNAKFGENELSFQQFGVKSRYYFKPLFNSSWYLGGQLGSFNLKVTETSFTTKSSGEFSSTLLGASFGYHWFWDSFNLRLGGLLGVFTGKSKVKLTSENSATEEDYDAGSFGAGIEFMIGFFF